MLAEKYPMIADIRVSEYSGDEFLIYLGVKYTDLYGKANDTAFENEIRRYVKRLSKFVVGSKDVIRSIVFFDPDHI